MKNYLSCLGARRVTTVAAAALVTLTLGLGTRALADDIEVVSTSDAAIATDQQSADGAAIRYLDEKGKVQEQPASFCTDISDESFRDTDGFELGDGWYVVKSDRDFSNRPNVVGDAKIILCDGVTAYFKKGIRCVSGKLTIYAQSFDDPSGTLIATGVDGGAGIGGGSDESNGSEIVICGGHVEATGAYYAAGIGGGEHGGCGTVRIVDGEIKATAPWPDEIESFDKENWDKGGGAGIGSGSGAKEGGIIEVVRADVTAESERSGAGIGSGDRAEKTVDVVIKGGDVKAESQFFGAGIGGGNETDGGRIVLAAGGIKAVGHYMGAGIGGGRGGDSGTIVIGVSAVEALREDGGVAIGHGEGGENQQIILSKNRLVIGRNCGRVEKQDQYDALNRLQDVKVVICDHRHVTLVDDELVCDYCVDVHYDEYAWWQSLADVLPVPWESVANREPIPVREVWLTPLEPEETIA